MRLELDRGDLKKEHAKIACSKTKFEHFKEDVQVAVKAVGKAMFYEFKGDKSKEIHNAIYPSH